MSLQERRIVRPGLFLAMVWGVVLVLTMYQPKVVQDAADKSDFLRGQPWLQSLLGGIEVGGDALGIGGVRNGLASLREGINAPVTVLAFEEPELPVEPDLATKTATKAVELAPDALVHIGPERPRRVLVIGASSIQFAVGVRLEKLMPTYAGVKVKRFGRLATGLSRPDFFDWPQKFRALAKAFKPDLVIANFGGNGAQAIPTDAKKIKYKTPAWDTAYGARVTEMVDIATEHGAQMIFMGMPVMRSNKFSAKMRYLNKVQQEAAEAAGAMFIPTYNMAALSNGKYRKSIKYKGKRGLMRTSDGVHYSKLGARYVVEQVLQQVERKYRLVPAKTDLGISEGHAFVSKVSSSTVSYVAYLPREADSAAKRPALLLMPGRAEGWARWPNYPHRLLQAQAQELGLVLIVPESSQALSWQSVTRASDFDDTVFAELVADVEAHLSVSGVVGVSGAGRGGDLALELHNSRPLRFAAVSVIGTQDVPRESAQIFVSSSSGDYSKALPAMLAWHAKQLGHR